MKTIDMYTSGWCIGNPSEKSGVGIVFVDNGQRDREISLFIGESTSNSCSLVAMIIGLQELSEPSQVTIYSHNQVIVKCASGEYGRHSNIEMWREYDVEEDRHEVSVQWIKKGTHEYNTLSTKLAKKAARY